MHSMMDYLMGLAGITLLCAAWMKFQLWLKRVDPERQGFRPGCGACQGGNCGTSASHNEVIIKPEEVNRSSECASSGSLGGTSRRQS